MISITKINFVQRHGKYYEESQKTELDFDHGNFEFKPNPKKGESQGFTVFPVVTKEITKQVYEGKTKTK